MTSNLIVFNAVSALCLDVDVDVVDHVFNVSWTRIALFSFRSSPPPPSLKVMFNFPLIKSIDHNGKLFFALNFKLKYLEISVCQYISECVGDELISDQCSIIVFRYYQTNFHAFLKQSHAMKKNPSGFRWQSDFSMFFPRNKNHR